MNALKVILSGVMEGEARRMVDWVGQRVVIVGAARQGTALARYLVHKGAHVVLNDRRSEAELESSITSLSDIAAQSVQWVLGGHPFEVLERADLVCLSGGVSSNLPLVVEARLQGIPLSNDSQIFLEATPCPVIGITGSAGKTTTTTLVGRMAQAASEIRKSNNLNFGTATSFQPHKVWVGGNIGSPLISVVDEMQFDDLAVMELSSFQLELMSRSPQVSAVLNVTPNHLDRHASMQEYTTAKARILDFQSPGDVAILGREDPGAWELASKVRGGLVSFGIGQLAPNQMGTFMRGEMIYLRDGQSEIRVMSRSSIGLRGEHNLLNVLAACAICGAAGVPPEAMAAGVEGFTGVAHRLEFVRVWHGASWYNDSIATAPERSIAAIRSFNEPLILLAGGRDKNLPWQEFADLVHQRVDHLILFGEAAEKIQQALKASGGEAGGRPYTIERCAGLQQAVLAASRVAEAGDVVLLSPGGTSFDEFRDFEHRGEVFRQWVMKLS